MEQAQYHVAHGVDTRRHSMKQSPGYTIGEFPTMTVN